MNAQPRDFMDKITEQDVLEAEQVILANIFANNEVLTECGLVADDFTVDLHRTIFASSLMLHAGRQLVNSVSLKPFIPKHLPGLTIAPAQYVLNLMFESAKPQTRSQYEPSLQIIKGTTLAREFGREAEFAATVAKEGHSLLTLGDEIEQMERRLKDLRARFSETTAIATPGSSYLKAFQSAARRDGLIGVPIALPEIAKVLSEPVFEAGNLYGLLSSSGEGKSSLTMQLIYHAVREGHPVLFLSYDQSAAQCIRQMIAQVDGIEVRQQREPMRLMRQNEQDQCVSFATWIDRQPFVIRRCQREGVTQLVTYARQFVKSKANGKTPFIVIDHIGKVKPRDPRLDAGRISGEVTVELKAFADEVAASVLILNQRNSKGMVRDNPRPIDEDLYGGEGAKADYDSVMYLYRPQKYRAKRVATAASDRDWKIINKVYGEFGDEDEIRIAAEVGVVKNRFGDAEIRERLKFEARYTRYVSLAPERPQELPL